MEKSESTLIADAAMKAAWTLMQLPLSVGSQIRARGTHWKMVENW